MALVLADRVKESCTSPGVGTATLLGAAAGSKTFSAGVGASNTTYYVIADQIGSNWEVGLGTIGAGGTTLVRTTPLSGSATTPVNFSTGTQDVFCDYTASTAVLASNNPGTSGQVLTSGGIGVAPSWAAAGTVTSVNASGGTTGLTFSGGPITAAGTLTLAGTLASANGGTGLSGSTPFTANGVLYASGASALATSSNFQFNGTNIGLNTAPSASVNFSNASNITGAATSVAFNTTGVIQSDVTTATYYAAGPTTAAASFTLATLNHFSAGTLTVGSGSTVTQQRGFAVTSGMTGATNNYGFFGNLASATGSWNLYMSGTAANYIAGQLVVGSTTLTNAYIVLGPTQSTNQYQVQIAGTNTYAGNPFGLIINPVLTGTSATTLAVGIQYSPQLNVASGASIGAYYAFDNQPTWSGTATPTSIYLTRSFLNLGASSTGTVTYLYNFNSTSIIANASSNAAITNAYGFYANNWATSNSVTITNGYGFYSGVASGTGRYNFYAAGTAANYFAGDMQFNKTVTAAGTTGAQTINKNAGTVNFAASATSLVVTNSLVTTSSIIICTVGANDTTMKSVQAVAGSGSFTLYANAGATAETRVNFIVIN